MDWLSWIIIAIIALGALGFVTWKIVQITRMSPEERKEAIKQWLVGAVVAAEASFKESGAGKEKMAFVKEQFKIKAPFAYKFLMRLTSDAELEDLIEKALAMVKENFE